VKAARAVIRICNQQVISCAPKGTSHAYNMRHTQQQLAI